MRSYIRPIRRKRPTSNKSCLGKALCRLFSCPLLEEEFTLLVIQNEAFIRLKYFDAPTGIIVICIPCELSVCTIPLAMHCTVFIMFIFRFILLWIKNGHFVVVFYRICLQDLSKFLKTLSKIVISVIR